MKEMAFKNVQVGERFKVGLGEDAVVHRKCTSTTAQVDSGEPFPIHPNNIVWVLDIGEVSKAPHVKFREIPIGGKFCYGLNSVVYKKTDTYEAIETASNTKVTFAPHIAVIPVVIAEPKCEAPATVGKPADPLTIPLSDKGYLRLTETGSLPFTYKGQLFKMGRAELTVGLIVDAWLEWEQREISTVEDEAAKEAESMVFESFGARYVWTQNRYDAVERKIRNIRQTARESMGQLLGK